MPHTATLRASCRAVAEEFHNPGAQVEAGNFKKRLAASIYRDKLTSGADYFGYNANRRRGRIERSRSTGVTFEGTRYERP